MLIKILFLYKSGKSSFSIMNKTYNNSKHRLGMNTQAETQRRGDTSHHHPGPSSSKQQLCWTLDFHLVKVLISAEDPHLLRLFNFSLLLSSSSSE